MNMCIRLIRKKDTSSTLSPLYKRLTLIDISLSLNTINAFLHGQKDHCQNYEHQMVFEIFNLLKTSLLLLDFISSILLYYVHIYARSESHNI